MNYPKFVIASDGYSTGVLLDGVFIGKGVERIEFVADGKSKEAKIRVLELDVKKATLEKDESKFAEFMDGLNFEKRLVEEMTEKEN